jgi:hypothetical protein
LTTAIVVAGVAMVVLGVVAVSSWPENGFVPAEPGDRWRQSVVILRRGLALARVDRVVLIVLVATLLVHGAGEAYGRLREKRLVALGMPTHPNLIVWFAAVNLVGFGLGAVVLRFVEARITGADVAKRTYLFACALGFTGLLLFAHAPNVATAVAGVLLVSGITYPVIRSVGVIWVNRRATSAVRATVHSLLSQAEHVGEITFGFALAIVARTGSTTFALTGSAALFACAAVLVTTARDEHHN